MFLTWFFNDRVLSTSMPSKLVESDLNTDSSQMVIGGSYILGRRGPLSTIMSDLSPLSFRILDVIQFSISLTKCSIMDAVISIIFLFSF